MGEFTSRFVFNSHHMKRLLFISLFLFCYSIGITQNPFRNVHDAMEVRYSAAQPIIHYVLRVDTSDLSSFWVEMQIRNIADTFRLAMVAHPEYDDKYWRYVRDLSITGKDGGATIRRIDSAVWFASTSGKQ